MKTALEAYTSRGVAQERKKIHESSKFIYPMREKSNDKNLRNVQTIGSFGTTSYSVDFAKKKGEPATPRPCSVTRRNRPHPSQVKTLECQEGNGMPPLILKILKFFIVLPSVLPIFFAFSFR